ncbi:hypothetical protein H6A23_08055 [Olsenella uli]|uniref:nitrilase-related carbon-nitrogen hydrolase n=1 Tax=Olsenella uli TaxID=133926 RepID=UPI00195CB05C|nr:nitrilase-related carbon-nitrogen hydrolase [Olsenella uli]MBM6817110.1 hypothetical protein [Olsenella uli]
MRIAIAQMRTRAGDFEGTSRRMAEQSRAAAEKNVDLLVFPATALCGASPVPYVDREGFLLDLAECLLGLVDELACPCLVPVLTDFDGVVLPEAMLVSSGGVVPVRLTSYLEAAASEEGDAHALPELEFAGARIGVAFTYEDLDEYDEFEYDVDVILFLSGYGFAADDVSSALGSSLLEGRYLADAEATGAWVVGVGGVGCYDGQVFCGSSFVLAPWGELAAQAPSLEEALLVCDVDPSAEGPLAEPLAPEVYDAPLMTWGALTAGLAEECPGEEGACVLVDDRIGSLLVATLATDALGPLRVRALLRRTGDAARDAVAESLVRALRIPEERVGRLEPVDGADEELSLDLAQARLAELARRTGAVPLGCADKTALALDGSARSSAARLQPLGDLYRSDVVALTHLRNTISPVIPAEASIPGPELDLGALERSHPTPEARLSFVDLVLSSYVEWELPVSDIVAERGHEEVVMAIVGRLRGLDSARVPRGLVLELSSKTLAEARAPRGLAWRDRVRAEDERAASRAAEALEMLREAEGEGGADGASARAGSPAGEDHEHDVRDLLGYLRDFSQGGGLSPFGTPSGEAPGRHGSSGAGPRLPWEGPFSEN